MATMLAQVRRQKIMDLLREDGSAKVTQLARLFKVTEVTIRQDLEKLEQEGFVHREHGGAFLKDLQENMRSFEPLNSDNMELKAPLGVRAASLVVPGDTIILDSGSTTTEIAKNLVGMKGLTIITNALNIALLLGVEAGMEVIVTGGEFKPPTLSLAGQKAADFFENIHVDKLFLATAGISLRAGLTYPSISDIAVKKAMIEAADLTYLVADSTKIGKNSLASLGALSLIDYLITNRNVDKKRLELFKENEVEVILA
jgi:DeoR/GlpR family transcriptional regulator of sugar metabolism